MRVDVTALDCHRKAKPSSAQKDLGSSEVFSCLTLPIVVRLPQGYRVSLRTNFPIEGFHILLELVLILGFAAACPNFILHSVLSRIRVRRAF